MTYAPSIDAMNAATRIRSALNRRADVEISLRPDGPAGTFDIHLVPPSGPVSGVLVQRSERPGHINVEVAGVWQWGYPSRDGREFHTLVLGQPHRPVRVKSSPHASNFSRMCQLRNRDIVELGYLEADM